MLSLMFGLTAAFAWAVHDLLARKIGPQTALLPMIFVVLAAGAVALAVPVALFGNWQAMTAGSYAYAAAAAFAYVLGMGGLYAGLSIAPVRLVAPIVGAFPLISLGLAALGGKVITPTEAAAVLAVVGGIAIVALTGRKEAAVLRPGAAILWSVGSAIGYATTFWLGQEAARQGDELASILASRIMAILIVLAVARALGAPLGQWKGAGKTLLVMGVLDAIAIGFVTASAQLANPEYAAIAASLFGVLTILLAWRVLKEQVQPRQWAGIVIVFAGIALLSVQG